jgi:DNA polymerase-3 subunit gamma/tau
LLSRAARGSMRDALSLTDQAIAHGGGRVDEALVRAMLGIADAEVAPTLVRCLAARDGAAVLDAVEELRRRGASFDSVLEQMCRLLQRMAVEQAVPGSLPDEELPAAEVCELAATMAAEDTQLLYSLLLNGRAELGLLSDDSMAFTMVLLRYLAFAPAASPSTAALRTAPLRASSTSAISVPAPLRRPAARPPPPAAATPPVDVPDAAPAPPVPRDEPVPAPRDAGSVAGQATALDDRWDALARRLVEDSLVSGLVRELAWQSTLAAIDPGPPQRWTLCNAHEALRTAGLRDRLAAALAQALGQPVEIDVVPGNPQASPAQREAQHRQRRQQEAEDSIRQDPVVRELLAQFSTARIVPGSIKPL